QCRKNSSAHVDQQHVHCAQIKLDDGAEGVERHHVEKQVSAIGMGEVREKHAYIIPARENLTRRENKHSFSRPAVHSRKTDERDEYIYSNKKIGQHLDLSCRIYVAAALGPRHSIPMGSDNALRGSSRSSKFLI